MAIKSLAQSSIRIAPQINSMLSGYQTNMFHHLETIRLGGTAASVEFVNLARYSDYQHLQIRVVSRDNRSTTGGNNVRVVLNGDTGSNYASHRLRGDGNTVSSLNQSSATSMNLFASSSLNDPANSFNVAVLDIVDPFEAKNKILRALQGGSLASTTSAIELRSGLWVNTAPLNSITFTPETTGSFVAGSRFSLYGIKAKA